ncbi:uncharacterized protein K452DRAFT_299157 [Aplosporella prunicola CBS 121167]|uniref:Uncharacterized protein n=1 Tax=Aplosporella prunicola CBS 121167 TaxID=1176127 RepID=A0A6A6BCV3_9PEZI|nr:uncharacterized protein K452DRAFT_299157 [Aplosporella prunicola CBS 121167]KAF2141115.1 hypothetical protein K452DRAFT_299157 [Aplosporella prunicola CBS 121167]
MAGITALFLPAGTFAEIFEFTQLPRKAYLPVTLAVTVLLSVLTVCFYFQYASLRTARDPGAEKAHAKAAGLKLAMSTGADGDEAPAQHLRGESLGAVRAIPDFNAAVTAALASSPTPNCDCSADGIKASLVSNMSQEKESASIFTFVQNLQVLSSSQAKQYLSQDNEPRTYNNRDFRWSSGTETPNQKKGT